ncbi:hypothetical protein SDC9_211389 [bioreactor metagenome]|uniref:Uncharacterized protein n=1 Tax=bioreactor metagenome TaxID=1076179 RepID=A0A645JIX0_9ZZZZ
MKRFHASDIIIDGNRLFPITPGYMSGIQQILCFGSRFYDFLRIIYCLRQIARHKSTPNDSTFHLKFGILVIFEFVVIVQRFFVFTKFNQTLAYVHDGGFIVGFQKISMLIKFKRFGKLAKQTVAKGNFPYCPQIVRLNNIGFQVSIQR